MDLGQLKIQQNTTFKSIEKSAVGNNIFSEKVRSGENGATKSQIPVAEGSRNRVLLVLGCLCSQTG